MPPDRVPEPARRPPPPPVVAVVLGVGVVAVLAAAVAPPWQFADRFGIWSGQWPDRPGASSPPLPAGTAEPLPPTNPDAGAWLGVLGWVLLGAALLAAAYVLWRVLPRRPTKVEAPPDLAAQPLGAAGPELSVAEVRAGLGAARHVLDTVADPTDAVLAAWVALEQAAERSGVPRRPADTPSEFTAELLTATPADAAAVSALLALYHRARFSSLGVGPDAVVEAWCCLDALERTWSSFSAHPVPGPTGPTGAGGPSGPSGPRSRP